MRICERRTGPAECVIKGGHTTHGVAATALRYGIAHMHEATVS